MADIKYIERLRPAGNVEKYEAVHHHLGFVNSVGVSATYSIPSNSATHPLKELIFRAITDVIHQHPNLSAVPVDEDKLEPYYVRAPEIDLEKCVEFVTRQKPRDDLDSGRDIELDELLSRLHAQNFKNVVPVWRVVILQTPQDNKSFVACFIYHHAIADGTSGLALHRSFLSALNAAQTHLDTSSEPPTPTIVKSPNTPMTPSLESATTLPISPLYIAKAALHSIKSPPNGLWSGPPIPDPTLAGQVHVSSFTFPAATTKRLVEASRDHSTTLTGTGQALLAAAMFANLAPEYTKLKICNALSLRRFIPRDVVDEDALGNWVGMMPTRTHERRKTDQKKHATLEKPSDGGGDRGCVHHALRSAWEQFSWDDARGVRRAIEELLAKEGRDLSVGLLRLVKDQLKFFAAAVGKKRETSVEMSNVGVFRPGGMKAEVEGKGATGGWKVGRMVFTQSGDLPHAAFLFFFVTGGDGGLTVSFCWSDGVVESEWMGKVMETLLGLMMHVAESEVGV